MHQRSVFFSLQFCLRDRITFWERCYIIRFIPSREHSHLDGKATFGIEAVLCSNQVPTQVRCPSFDIGNRARDYQTVCNVIVVVSHYKTDEDRLLNYELLLRSELLGTRTAPTPITPERPWLSAYDHAARISQSRTLHFKEDPTRPDSSTVASPYSRSPIGRDTKVTPPSVTLIYSVFLP